MPIHPATDDLIEFLDSLAKIDPVGMGKLLAARVPCNGELGRHPTVQVSAHGEGGHYADIPPGEHRVGFLGVINGFAGTFDDGPRKGWGPISAVVEDDGRVTSFRHTDNTEALRDEIANED